MNSRQERLFLAGLHSMQDHNSVNEHIRFPQVYLPLAASLGIGRQERTANCADDTVSNSDENFVLKKFL